MSIFYPERDAGYGAALASQSAILDGQLARIRVRQDAGDLTIRQAADERIAALTAHLDELRRLRELYL